MLELSCPAMNISQLLDMRMPAVVLNDPKMDRGIRINNQVVDQFEQVAETYISSYAYQWPKEEKHYFDCTADHAWLADQFFKQRIFEPFPVIQYHRQDKGSTQLNSI